MNVSQEVKDAFLSSSTTKHLVIEFPSLGDLQIYYKVPENDVYMDSMILSEKLMETQNLEIVGCISTRFEVDIRDFGQDIKGQKIVASIYVENYEEQPIRLFTGIIDEAKLQSNHKIKKIVAYDELYTLGNKDVSKWYKRLRFPLTLGELRASLFNEIGLVYESGNLPCDGFKIQKKYYNPSQLPAIDMIKSICQINAVFGMMDRFGTFRFISLPQLKYRIVDGAIPGETLYPPFYPGVSEIPVEADSLPRYKTLDYQEYSIKPIGKIIIRQDSESDGGEVTYDEDNPNVYIIQGNVFTYKMNNKTLKNMCTAIYNNLRDISFVPYRSENVALPWLECGRDAIDCVVYDFQRSEEESTPDNPVDIYKQADFYILNRTMSGIQNLRDKYSVDGDEYQKEFVTDLGVNIDLRTTNIKKEILDQVDEDYYNKDEIDDMIGGITPDPGPEPTPGTGWSVESVSELPAHGEPEVLYLVQGEVVVE